MFARDGGGGGDDPYNFDIADGYGGGSSKKKSKQSKLGKGLMRKTLGSSPSSSSAMPHMSIQESFVPSELGAGANPSKAPLRASAPAAPTSALDKAMDFLNKYKQGDPKTPSTSIATGVSAFRRSSAANTLEEDDMDMLLSSDSDTGGKVTHKAASRLRADRGSPEPGSEQDRITAIEDDLTRRSLTGVRSPGHFATAKELGINESGGLDRPKAAVSPVGLQKQRTAIGSAVGARYHDDDTRPPSGSRSSGLRVAVNIPGSSHTSVVKQRHDSDGEGDSSVESVSVAAAGALALKEIRGEARTMEGRPRLESTCSELASSYEMNAEGSSSLLSPSFEREAGSFRNPNKVGSQNSSPRNGASDKGFARNHPGSTLGNVMSFDELAKVSGQRVALTSDRMTTVADTGRDSGRSVNIGVRESQRTEEASTGDEEDDYGDDDFEEVDAMLESKGEGPSGEGPHDSTFEDSNRADEHSESVVQAATECHATSSSSERVTTHTSSDDKKRQQIPLPTMAACAARVPPTDKVVDHQKRESLGKVRQAWDDPPMKSHFPVTAESGTSPQSGSYRDSDDDGELAQSRNESSSTGAKEAWVGGPTRASWTEGARSSAQRSTRTGTTNGDSIRPALVNGGKQKPRSETVREREGVEAVCGVSHGGVLIDRSTQVHDPERPSGTEVKVIVRAEAVASVEYAHDPEKGLDLRSFGTQAVGSSAAVQVNIAVPGMLGTRSAMDDDLRTSGARTAGIGYRPGESYAKWGRFACEAPSGSSWGRDHARAGGATRQSTHASSRRRPRSSAAAGITSPTPTEQRPDGIGNGQASDGPVETKEGVAQPEGGEWENDSGARFPTRSPAPSYMQTFLDVMAKSQAETCSVWQQVLEDTARPPRLYPPADGEPPFEEETRKEDSAQDKAAFSCATRGNGEGWSAGPGELDVETFGITTATQDSFRRQLAAMRENLNKIRYRAEVAGRQAYAYHYESVTDTRDRVGWVRPRAAGRSEAPMTVDPTLTLEKAEASQDHRNGTMPSSPIEPQPTCPPAPRDPDNSSMP